MLAFIAHPLFGVIVLLLLPYSIEQQNKRLKFSSLIIILLFLNIIIFGYFLGYTLKWAPRAVETVSLKLDGSTITLCSAKIPTNYLYTKNITNILKKLKYKSIIILNEEINKTTILSIKLTNTQNKSEIYLCPLAPNNKTLSNIFKYKSTIQFSSEITILIKNITFEYIQLSNNAPVNTIIINGINSQNKTISIENIIVQIPSITLLPLIVTFPTFTILTILYYIILKNDFLKEITPSLQSLRTYKIASLDIPYITLASLHSLIIIALLLNDPIFLSLSLILAIIISLFTIIFITIILFNFKYIKPRLIAYTILLTLYLLAILFTPILIYINNGAIYNIVLLAIYSIKISPVKSIFTISLPFLIIIINRMLTPYNYSDYQQTQYYSKNKESNYIIFIYYLILFNFILILLFGRSYIISPYVSKLSEEINDKVLGFGFMLANLFFVTPVALEFFVSNDLDSECEASLMLGILTSVMSLIVLPSSYYFDHTMIILGYLIFLNIIYPVFSVLLLEEETLQLARHCHYKLLGFYNKLKKYIKLY